MPENSLLGQPASLELPGKPLPRNLANTKMSRVMNNRKGRIAKQRSRQNH